VGSGGGGAGQALPMAMRGRHGRSARSGQRRKTVCAGGGAIRRVQLRRRSHPPVRRRSPRGQPPVSQRSGVGFRCKLLLGRATIATPGIHLLTRVDKMRSPWRPGNGRRPKKVKRAVFRRAVPGLRFYSPRLGRWISRDPIGELGGKNLQQALFNNPVRYVDGLGHVNLFVALGITTSITTGGAIVVYQVSVWLADLYVHETRRSRHSDNCCRLEALAAERGVDVNDAMPGALSGFNRTVYCRHCLDCNALAFIHVRTPLLSLA
jgi:hypothetical protein